VYVAGVTELRLLFTKSLLSNRSIRNIAPSLTYRHFFFSKGCACDICDRFRLLLRGSAFRSVYSPTTLAASSLRPLVSCRLVQVYHHHLPPVGAVKSSESGHALTTMAPTLKLLLGLSFFSEGATPPHCPDAHFPQSNTSHNCSLHDLQL
jgi:hypothetical protein